MKNNVKFIIVGLLAFVLSLSTAYAREFKDLDSLGKEILNVNPGAEGFYLVGEYAFTTSWNTTVQDAMLAARSIDVDSDGKINTDPIYKEMTIYTIDAVYGNNGQITNWKIGKALYGDNTLEEDLKTGINVTYIDYGRVKDLVSVDTDEKLKTAFEGYENTSLFTFNTDDIAKGNITSTVKNLKSSIAVGMKSGVVDTLRTFLTNNPEVESIEFKSDIKGVEPFTFTSETTDREIEDWAKVNLIKVFGENADGITADLIGKSFTAKLNLGESDTEKYFAKKNSDKSVEYTITFDGKKEEVDTDDFVDSASKSTKLNSDMFSAAFDKTNHTVTVTVKDIEKQIAVGMGSGVISALKEILENENVKSIEFTYEGAEPFVLTNDTTTQEITDWLANNLSKIFSSDIEGITYDLIGKSFTAKVNLRSFAEKKAENPDEYTVTFTGNKKTVDVDTIVKNASSSETLNSDMFNASYNDGTVTVTVKEGELDATIIKGMGSGVLATLEKILKDNSSIKSIEFKANIEGVEPFTYTSDTTDAEIAEWLSNNLMKVLGEDADGILADLIGKTFKATVNLKYYAEKKTENKEEYTFKFTGTPKTVTGKQLLGGGFIADDYGTSVINGTLYSVTLEDKNITVTATDATTEIKPGMNSGVLVAMDELFKSPEVKSVTFRYKDLEFTYDANTTIDTITNWLQENEAKITKLFSKSTLTNEDLKGKSFTATINLKNSATFGESKSETYTVTFKVEEHTITFENASNKVEKVDGGKTLSQDKIPQADAKEGHEFAYWYDSSTDGKTEYDFNIPVKKNVTLKAKYLEIVKNEQIANSADVQNAINNSRSKHFSITDENGTVTVNYNKNLEAKTMSQIAMLQGTGINDALAKLFTNKKLSRIELVGFENCVVNSSTSTTNLALQMMTFLPTVAKQIAGEEDYSSMQFKEFWEKYKDTTVQVRLVPADGVKFDDDVVDVITIKLGETPFQS